MNAGADVLERARKDPEWFFRAILGCHPWPQQIAIAEAVRDHGSVAVPSCHSSGKSWIAARIVLWFLYSHPASKVITTAPTARQAKGILWSEIATAHRRSRYPLGGEITSTQLSIEPDWWALGFTAPEWDPSRFQGFHAPYVLVVLDEASGISSTLMDQVDSLLSAGHTRKLQIGNPVESGTPFEEDCSALDVKTIRITAWDTPNFTAFGLRAEDFASGAWQEKVGDVKLPNESLISPQWVAERYARWGPTSNAWRSRICAEFPDRIEGSYFSDELKAARETSRVGAELHDPAVPVVTGWDLGIGDSNAIWFAQMQGSTVRLIDYIEERNRGLLYYLELIKSRGYLYGEHFAPHDMAVRDYSLGKSRTQVAADHGIHFTVIPRTSSALHGEVSERIDAIRRLLPISRFDEVRCADGLIALSGYHRKRSRAGALLDEPEHDQNSHGVDAFGCLAHGLQLDVFGSKIRRPQADLRWVR